MSSLTNDFTSNLYSTIHKMMSKSSWTFTELMNIPPLEMNIFKGFIIKDIKKKNG